MDDNITDIIRDASPDSVVRQCVQTLWDPYWASHSSGCIFHCCICGYVLEENDQYLVLLTPKPGDSTDPERGLICASCVMRVARVMNINEKNKQGRNPKEPPNRASRP